MIPSVVRHVNGQKQFTGAEALGLLSASCDAELAAGFPRALPGERVNFATAFPSPHEKLVAMAAFLVGSCNNGRDFPLRVVPGQEEPWDTPYFHGVCHEELVGCDAEGGASVAGEVGDLVSSNGSGGVLNNNTIRRTNGWFV